ncbi:MAG: N-acetylmuramoyl-L-alanine amidase [Thermoleophilia bacterium]|nr:N-acetylmuramoyl-L-alanine amidase [Thermoleophilia bacterium]
MSPRLSRRDFLRWSGALAVAVAAPPDVFGASTIQVISREAWGAEPPLRSLRPHEIRRITVHHSGVELASNRLAPARFRSHQRAHRARGWPDIAYHLLIDRHGNVYEGRPRWASGDTATAYDPRGDLLLLCEGHFGRQEPSEAQIGSLVAVLAWAVRRYGVPVSAIRGHRAYVSTACPGARLERRLREVRRRVKAGGAGELALVRGAAAQARVRAIEAGRR